MNKVLKGLVAVAATAAMAVAGFAGASTAMAAENNVRHHRADDRHAHLLRVPGLHRRSERRHAEQYQGRPELQQDNTANKSAADAAAEIAQGTYADNTAKLAAITPYVDLAGTAYGEVSAKTACPLLLATTCLRIRML